MKSVYVTKQTEFIVSTQNALLTATVAYSCTYSDPFAKFFLICFVTYCWSIFGWLVGFKNHRGQNLRDFTYLKFCSVTRNLKTEKKGGRVVGRQGVRYTLKYTFFHDYCCLQIKCCYCFRHCACSAFLHWGGKGIADFCFFWTVFFNNKLGYGFESWFQHFVMFN